MEDRNTSEEHSANKVVLIINVCIKRTLYEIEIMFRLIMQYIRGNVIKIKDVTEESFGYFIVAIPLCCSTD